MKYSTIAVLSAALLISTPSVFGAATALQRNVQITEVNFEDSTLTLQNLHPTIGVSLNGWRFCSHDDDQTRRYSSSSGLNGITLDPGESLTIHFLNDSAGAAGTINSSSVGSFAGPLDRGPYAIQLYNQDAGFGNGTNIVDHMQWNIGGVDNTNADERTDEAVNEGGVWTNQNAWIPTTASTVRIDLTSPDGTDKLQGPVDYTVVEPPTDTTPPTLISIEDTTWPSSAFVGDSVVYTITFSEGMDPATLGSDDFENGSTAGVSVSGVSTTADTAVFEVTVGTFSPGDLTLQIKAGAVLADLAGNTLATTAALVDDTTILIAPLPPGDGGDFDTWAVSNGVPAGSESVDSDGGGQNNFYEFAMGGSPAGGNDDGSLLHHFVADGDGDEDKDALLTILVRSDAVFAPSGNSQTATVDGVTYTISGDSGLPVGAGVAVSVATTTVTTGLPAAPAGYKYISFILAGSIGEGLAQGLYQAVVQPSP